MTDAARVLIIGGGIGGLASAFRLRAAAGSLPLEIILAEAGARFGGVTESSRSGDFLFEHGPDAIIRTKPAGLQLIEDCGLGAQIQDTDPDYRAAYILRGTRLIRVPDGLYLMAPSRFLPFALSPLISWPGKLRMGLDLLLPRRQAEEEESLADFVRRRLGREALERLAQPMVSGIYTADPEQLSLDLAMPQFAEMERDHRSLILAMRANRARQAALRGTSGPRYGLFLSLQGGLQTLVDGLVTRLPEVDLRLHTPVHHIRRSATGFTVRLGAEQQSFDAIIACAPAHAVAGLCRDLHAVLAEELAGVRYGSVATLNLVYDRRQVGQLPPGAGFVIPAIEGRNLIACTIASQKFADRAPADQVVLRAFIGGALQAAQLAVDDDTLIARASTDLADILQITGPPQQTILRRWERSMAQPVLGLRDRVARIDQLLREAVPGLHLVGSGFDGVGIPDVAAQAQKQAVACAAWLKQHRAQQPAASIAETP